MKLNEFTRNLKIWVNNEEQALLEKVLEPVLMNSFTEREQVIIESLIRKNLLIKVNGQHSTYIYPNR